MIEGVSLKSLRVIPDARGCVRRFMRCDEEDFHPVREVYVTEAYRGIFKGWHGYEVKTLSYAVVYGMVQLVLVDTRRDSSTFQDVDTFFLGDDNYSKVTIPPGVFNGFRALADSIVVVAADRPFDEKEIIRFPKEYFDYDWSLR